MVLLMNAPLFPAHGLVIRLAVLRRVLEVALHPLVNELVGMGRYGSEGGNFLGDLEGVLTA